MTYCLERPQQGLRAFTLILIIFWRMYVGKCIDVLYSFVELYISSVDAGGVVVPGALDATSEKHELKKTSRSVANLTARLLMYAPH